MSTNGANVEDTEMAECDGEKVVTMMDVLQEQQEFEEDANAVLGASDDKNCTYSKGYIKRQAVYACLTCCHEAKHDPDKRAGVCLACSLTCHENHDLVELYTKRNFRCDCGNPKFKQPCQYTENKTSLNDENVYNQNFSGLYCICHRPYPDPDGVEEEMIQCIVCEDWLHASHLEATVPSPDLYAEMICKACMDKNDFLHDYGKYAVNGDGDVDVVGINEIDNSKHLNGDTHEINNIINVKTDKSEIEEDKGFDKLTTVGNSTKGNTSHNNIDENDSKEQMQPNLLDTEKAEDENPPSEKTKDENTSTAKTEDEIPPTEQTEKETPPTEQTEKENPPTEKTVDEIPPTEQTEKENPPTEKTEDENPPTEKTVDENPPTEKTVDENSPTERTEDKNLPTNDAPKNESEVAEKTEDESLMTAKTDDANKIEPVKTSDENNLAQDIDSDKPNDANLAKENQAEDKLTSDNTDNNLGDNVESVPSFGGTENMQTNNTDDSNLNERVTDQNQQENTVEAMQESTSESYVNGDHKVNDGIDKSSETTSQEKQEHSVDSTLMSADNTNVETLTVTENNVGDEEIKENKRKLSTEDSSLDVSAKKPKLSESGCLRPQGERKMFKGATFWPCHFRQKLCTCNECITMYKDLSVLFIIDPEDTVTAYEVLGKEKADGGASTQYEKGLEALSSLGRIQQINALTEYNKMRDKLLDFLKSFKDRKEVVKEEDIKAFFAGMKPKREPDGVYFCR